MFEFHANVNLYSCAKIFKIFTLGMFKVIILKSMQEQNEGNIVLFLLTTIHKNRREVEANNRITEERKNYIFWGGGVSLDFSVRSSEKLIAVGKICCVQWNNIKI